MQALCEHGAAGHHIALDWRVEWAAGKVRTRVLAKARSSDLEGATATIASPARLLNACKAALATADSIFAAWPLRRLGVRGRNIHPISVAGAEHSYAPRPPFSGPWNAPLLGGCRLNIRILSPF